MKAELLNIIDNSDEAVYELDAFLTQQKGVDIEKGWETLKEIALKGTQEQKFVALTVISVNRPSYLEELSTELINNFNFSEIESFLIPIIKICSVIENELHINYMEEVLNYARKNKKKYLEEVTLRSIISTKYWKRVIGIISQVVSNSDTLTMVDLLAFFIYKQGKDEYNLLMNHFPKKNQEKIAKLQLQILERVKTGYQILNVK
jgi:hypothetical protein